MTSNAERLEEIERTLRLLHQVRALEKAGMQGSVVEEMAAAVPDALVRQLVKDFGRGVSAPSSMIPPKRDAVAPVQSATPGWVDAVPLRPPPGDKIIGQLLDAEDRRWRAERARELGVAAIKRRV
jgi:hypothetical protein